MSKKFERMENVLLMEAKEVKGIKDRINDIDNVLAKNYINNKSTGPSVDNSAIDDIKEDAEQANADPTHKEVEKDSVRTLPHRFRSVRSQNKHKQLKRKGSENDITHKARDLQQKMRSMGDDSKSLADLEQMITNSKNSFIQTTDNILSFKNKLSSELKKTLSSDQKTEMDKVTKMG